MAASHSDAILINVQYCISLGFELDSKYSFYNPNYHMVFIFFSSKLINFYPNSRYKYRLRIEHMSI